MLTLEALAFLRSSPGERLLSEAAAVLNETGDELRTLTLLRRSHAAMETAAAVETVQLRRRAATKFREAARMFFTADALEQATGETVAEYSAARFASFTHVLDLCCGIGGDTVALARHARVTAIDSDPLRLAIARANAEVCGVADRVTFVLGDVTREALPAADAAFCDPGRRDARGRIFDVRRYHPPLADVLRLARRPTALAIKVAPGIRDEDVPPGCEAEFIQDGPGLKQAVLWLGSLAGAARRATLLPGPLTLAQEEVPPLSTAPPRTVLYEPEPAVIRAHLVQQLGQTLGATLLDPTTAFLSADSAEATPFARAFQIEEWLPFNLKALQRRLRALDVGHVVVKKRGSPLDPQELERALRLDGAGERILVLTRVLGRHAVLICREARAGDDQPRRVDTLSAQP